MPPAVAIGAAAVGSIAGSAISASAQKKAANKAGDISLINNRENNALAEKNRDLLTSKIEPYNQQGIKANGQINSLLGEGMYAPGLSSQYTQTMNPGSFDDWKKNTGYDYNLNQGIKGIGIGAGAGGWLQSGAAVKGALRFQDDLSTRAYGDYRNALGQYGTYADQFANNERGYQTDQRNNYFNQWAGQQGVGMSAVNALAGVGNNYTSQVMNNNNQGAAAAANAALAKGNANAGMYASMGNALGYGLGAITGGGGGSPYGGNLGAIY